MKIKFDIDCTPEELRSFFGLPDVRPMQDELLKDVEERLRANLKALDPETMLKTWLLFCWPMHSSARRLKAQPTPAAGTHPLSISRTTRSL